jgi:glycosyltransferase involved in cell wall biosynthesis
VRYLFIHQNFPGQFRHIAAALAAAPSNEVVALVDQANRRDALTPAGLRLVSYATPQGASKTTHPYLQGYEASVRRGQQIVRACLALRQQGFTPDIVCAHAGWGEALFIKEVFPEAILLDYFEFFYRTRGSDVGFDQEMQAPSLDGNCKVLTRNSCHLLSMQTADWGWSPTQWQAGQFPEHFRSRLSVIHEGIDTDVVKPNQAAVFELPNGEKLSKRDQVVTFVNRNLEPYRGFHSFMRALPRILKAHPKAQVVLVGGDAVSYGNLPKEGGNWREKMLAEVGDQLDMDRVHFVGRLPYERYLSLIQVSSAHVYLTYPFVLSWSMLESMATECVLIASDTAPVTEVVEHEKNGLLVDFFDVDAIAEQVKNVLDKPEQYRAMREQARKTILERYDLKSICLPQQLDLLQALPERVTKAVG